MGWYNYNLMMHNDVSLYYVGYKPTGYVFYPYVEELSSTDSSVGSYPDSSLPNAGEGYYDFSDFFRGCATNNVYHKLHADANYQFGAIPHKVSGDNTSASNPNVKTVKSGETEHYHYFYPIIAWLDTKSYSATGSPETDRECIYMSDEYGHFNCRTITDYDDRSANRIDISPTYKNKKNFDDCYLNVAVPCLDGNTDTVISSFSIRVHQEGTPDERCMVLPNTEQTVTYSEYLLHMLLPGSVKGTYFLPISNLGHNNVTYVVFSYHLFDFLEDAPTYADGLRTDEGGIDYALINYKFPDDYAYTVQPEIICPLNMVSEPWNHCYSTGHENSTDTPVYWRKLSANKWSSSDNAFKVSTNDSSVPMTLCYISDLTDWYPTGDIKVFIDSSLLDEISLSKSGLSSTTTNGFKHYPIKGNVPDSYGNYSIQKTYYINFSNFTPGNHYITAEISVDENQDYFDYGNYRCDTGYEQDTAGHFGRYRWFNWNFTKSDIIKVSQPVVNNVKFGFVNDYNEYDAYTNEKTVTIPAEGGTAEVKVYSSNGDYDSAYGSTSPFYPDNITINTCRFNGTDYNYYVAQVLEYGESYDFTDVTVSNNSDITTYVAYGFKPTGSPNVAAVKINDNSGDITDSPAHHFIRVYLPKNNTSGGRTYRFELRRSEPTSPIRYLTVTQPRPDSTTAYKVKIRNNTSSTMTEVGFYLRVGDSNPLIKGYNLVAGALQQSSGNATYSFKNNLTSSDIQISGAYYKTSANTTASGSFVSTSVAVSGSEITVTVGSASSNSGSSSEVQYVVYFHNVTGHSIYNPGCVLVDTTTGKYHNLEYNGTVSNNNSCSFSSIAFKSTLKVSDLNVSNAGYQMSVQSVRQIASTEVTIPSYYTIKIDFKS